MRILLIGYGKMGHAVEQVALQRGHTIAGQIDKDSLHLWDSIDCDVAIEFSTPPTALGNVQRALQKGIPVVSGTTGWDVDSLLKGYPTSGTPWIWSPNYSIGVQLFFLLNRQLAHLLQPWQQYRPAITETHHIHKLDKPSGTAKHLVQDLQAEGYPSVSIASIRAGEVAGIHTVDWDSEEDTITISHSAKSRAGFALGAVIAAEWLQGKTGAHTMEEVMKG